MINHNSSYQSNQKSHNKIPAFRDINQLKNNKITEFRAANQLRNYCIPEFRAADQLKNRIAKYQNFELSINSNITSKIPDFELY